MQWKLLGPTPYQDSAIPNPKMFPEPIVKWANKSAIRLERTGLIVRLSDGNEYIVAWDDILKDCRNRR